MEIMVVGIYVIERIETGQIYVGQSSNIEKRMWEAHYNSDLIYRALKKYGKEEFIRYVIQYCEIDDLDYWENYYIINLHSHKSEGGYNITWGGNAPMRGRKHTESAKILMSNNHWDCSGENNPMYGVQSPNYGKSMSDDRKEKQRLAMTGKNNPNYGKRGELSPLYGTHPSVETRKLLSDALSGENHPMWGKFGKDNPNFGLKRTLETRKLMSDASSGEKSYLFGTKRTSTTSKYYGVYKYITNNKYIYWRVCISRNGKFTYVCQRKTDIEAAKEYDKYIVENNINHPLNFPDGIHPYWEIQNL